MTANLVDGEVRFNGLWNPSTAPQFLALGYSAPDFQAEYGAQWNAGYKLAGLTTHVQNDEVFYSGFWNPSGAGQGVHFGAPEPGFLASYGDHWSKGFRLGGLVTVHVESLAINRMAT